MNPSHILVIRFSSLGDLILTSPVFRELKRVFPQAHITFLTSDSLGPVLANHSAIDDIIYHPRKETRQELNQLIQRLCERPIDLVYDIHASVRSRWIAWKLRKHFPQATYWQIQKRGWQRSLLIHAKWLAPKVELSQRHIFLEPLQAHTSTPLDAHTELFPSVPETQAVQVWLQQNDLLHKPFIAIGASASAPNKCWPIPHFQALIEKLLPQMPVVLLGGKNEWETQQLQEYFGKDVFCVAGKWSFLESAAFLKEASLVLSNDTALIHMAEAMNTPGIALFGPTSQEFGYSPFLKKSQRLEVPLPCRPCTRNGKGRCHLAEKKLCLTSITPERVYEAIQTTMTSE